MKMDEKVERGNVETEEMVDRLNALPVELVKRILYFLETKTAVQTSVLCRGWRHLWTSLPTININSDSFSCYSSFDNFVVQLLSRRYSSSVSACRFSSDISNPIYYSLQMCIDGNDLYEPLVESVIEHLVFHRVQYLSLRFPRIVDNLTYLFACQSLITLELVELVIIPIALDFSTLTALHLFKCSFIVDESDSLNPFEGCLNLRNLTVSDCRIPSQFKIFKISAPELTNLIISRMTHGRNISPNCEIVISSTKIMSFNFTESHILEFSLATLPFRDALHIDATLTDHLHGTDLKAKQKFVSHLIDMFWAIGDAETVVLSFNTINLLSEFPDELGDSSPFPQMKVLIVRVPHEPRSITLPVKVLTFLLNGSPAKAFTVEYRKVTSKAGA